jgi:hypothetical protein
MCVGRVTALPRAKPLRQPEGEAAEPLRGWVFDPDRPRADGSKGYTLS